MAALLGIRPEAIQVAEQTTADEPFNRAEGRITASVYQGAFVEYEILAHGRVIKARVANPKGKFLHQRGERVIVGVAPEDVILVPNGGSN